MRTLHLIGEENIYQSRISFVRTMLHISQATAILLLREMAEEGILVKKGTAKNLRYYLPGM